MAVFKTPMTGAVKMPQYHGLSLGEKLLGKVIGALAASKPAAYDVEGALRRPKAVQQATQVFVLNAFTAQNRRGELAHSPG